MYCEEFFTRTLFLFPENHMEFILRSVQVFVLCSYSDVGLGSSDVLPAGRLCHTGPFPPTQAPCGLLFNSEGQSVLGHHRLEEKDHCPAGFRTGNVLCGALGVCLSH